MLKHTHSVPQSHLPFQLHKQDFGFISVHIFFRFIIYIHIYKQFITFYILKYKTLMFNIMLYVTICNLPFPINHLLLGISMSTQINLVLSFYLMQNSPWLNIAKMLSFAIANNATIQQLHNCLYTTARIPLRYKPTSKIFQLQSIFMFTFTSYGWIALWSNWGNSKNGRTPVLQYILTNVQN